MRIHETMMPNVKRDLILDNIAAHTPEIYRLVHAAYSWEIH